MKNTVPGRRLGLLAILAGAALGMAACDQTVRGVGQDIRDTGQAVGDQIDPPARTSPTGTAGPSGSTVSRGGTAYPSGSTYPGGGTVPPAGTTQPGMR